MGQPARNDPRIVAGVFVRGRDRGKSSSPIESDDGRKKAKPDRIVQRGRPKKRCYRTRTKTTASKEKRAERILGERLLLWVEGVWRKSASLTSRKWGIQDPSFSRSRLSKYRPGGTSSTGVSSWERSNVELCVNSRSRSRESKKKVNRWGESRAVSPCPSKRGFRRRSR